MSQILLALQLLLWAKRQYALNRQLITALVKNDIKQALVLINAGADPNTPYNSPPSPTFRQFLDQMLHRSPSPGDAGDTALTFTCAMHSDGEDRQPRDDAIVDLAQSLLVHGADVNVTTEHGITALEMAAFHNHPGIVGLLLAHHANINAQNENGSTPLMDAANYSYRCPGMVSLLLAYGADIQLQDNDGNTALHRAVYGYAELGIVEQLLVHGANPNQANKHGRTPLTIAQEQCRLNIVAFLRKGVK